MGTRGTWTIYSKSTGSWVADGTIYPPNSDIIFPEISTQSKSKSADGDNIFFTPATKYVKEPISWVWYAVNSTFKNKIRTYFRAGTSVKIVDDNSVNHIGRFTSYNESRLIADGEEDVFNVQATLEQIPSLA